MKTITLKIAMKWLCPWLALTSILQAALPQFPTALVILNTTTGANEFSPVLEYAGVDFESAVALRVITPNGRTVSLSRDQIGLVFHYPDPSVALSGEGDMKILSLKRAEALALESRYPKAKAALDRVIAGIDADLQKLAAGQARYSGVWQNPSGPASTANSTSVIQSLTYKGHTYTHLTLSRLDKGCAILTHEGGILRIPLTDAGSDLVHAIQSKPALFQSMKPLPAFTVGSQKFSSVIALDLEVDPVVLWHQGGVLGIPASQLNKAQFQSLTATNPNLQSPALSAEAKPEAASTKTKLVLIPGQGSRDPERGWRCSEEEKNQWLLASGDPIDQTNGPVDMVVFFQQTRDNPPRDLPKIDPEAFNGGYYRKALEFINRRIAPLELGFSRPNHCMIIRNNEGGANEIQAAFSPRTVDANVRYKVGANAAVVVLEGLDGVEALTLYQHERPDQGPDRLWRNQVNRTFIPIADPDDAPRVAKALANVLAICGARLGKF